MDFSKLSTTTEIRLRNRYELAIEGSGFGIWQFDIQAGHLIWNEKMHEVYDHLHEPFSGKVEDWKKLVHPEDIEIVERKFLELMAGQRVQLFEFRIITPVKKECRYIEANGILDMYENGKPLMVLGMNRDISDAKKLNFQIEEDRLTRITNSRLAAMGELAAGIAHEINNPLAIFLGQIEKFKKRLNQNREMTVTEIENNLCDMEKNVFRMNNIIKGLLSFARGGTNDAFEIKSIHEHLNDSIVLMNERIEKSQTKVVIESYFKNANFFVKSKPGQLCQVILNLICNSIDAIEGLSEKWVSINLVEVGDHYFVISITDSGQGISTSDQSNIARPFFTTKPAGKGSGLGLSICKKILNDLGGNLEYNSNSKNTQFLIKLPLAGTN